MNTKMFDAVYDFYKSHYNQIEKQELYKWKAVLIFLSESEKESFKAYAASKWSERQNYLEDVILPHIELPQGYCEDAFKEDYENAIVLKKMLDEYRTYS